MDNATPKRRNQQLTTPERRDADSARAAAAERVARAQAVADSVEAYHAAADRIDAANSELAKAKYDRLAALRSLRAAKLTVAEIVSLTGLSPSRVQALTRTAAEDTAPSS